MDDLNIQAGVTVNAEQAERAFDNLGNKAQKMASEVTKAADRAGKATDGIGDGADKGADRFTRAESRMRSAIQKSTRDLELFGKTASQKFEAQLEFKGLDKAKFQPFLEELRKTEEAAAKAQTGVSGIGDAASIAGSRMAAAFSGAALLGVVGKVVAVQREFDVLNSSLKTVTGSSAAAEREMAWLKDFAKETPFGLAQATQGFVKMKALGLDPTRGALTSFGNTASAMGKDLNQMIEAVADASTGEFERLKEFGIKAKKEGDNVSLTFQGVTTTIKNSASEITQYLEDIGNTSFGGAMEERAKTLDGTIAALGDTWDELFRTVSTNNVGSLIFDSVTLANGVLEDATTILRAYGAASSDAARETGALSSLQGGVAIFFETVGVMAANVLYVLKQTGDTLGGLAAGYKAFFSFDFDAVRAIGEEMRANGEAARKEIDATTERILNARKEAGIYASYATRNASAATDPRRIDLGSTPKRATPVSVPKPKKEDLSDYDKLIQKLGVEIPKAAAEAEAAQNGYNKAQTEFLELARSPAWAKFTESERARVAALFENKIASEQAAEAAKTLAKGNTDAAQARERYLTSLDNGLDKIRADIQAQQDATARMGLSKQAIAALDAAKLEMLATDLELQAIKAMDRNLDQQTYDALKKQAAGYRELAKAKQEGAAKEASIEYEKASAEAAQKAQEDWRRAAEDINNSLTDALLRGFESGKDFAKNFRDTLVNMFKTLILRPTISAILNPVAGALTGALGLAAPAAAAASGASALSGASGLLSGVGMLAGNFGAGITTGFGQLLSGNILGGLQLGGGLIGSGATAGGLGTIAGVLGPIALGLGALSAIIGKTKGETRTGGQFGVAFDGQVMNNRRGETYTYQGQQFDRDFSNGQRNALVNGQAYRLEGDPVAQEQAIRDAVAGTASGINAFFEALGSTARLSGFSAGLETSGKGRGGVFAGGTLSDGTTFGESGRGDNYAGTLFEKFSSNSPDFKQALEDFTLDLKQSTIQALQSVTDIPEAIKKQIEGVDAESLTAEAADSLLTAINAQIVGVEQFTTALDGMGLTQFADMAFDTAAAIAEAAGGFENLNNNLASYYQNYYSEAERAANTTRMVSEALAEVGLEMPKTRDEFRALVESQLALGDAGAQTVAVLLGMSDAFASITEGASSVQDAFRVTADGLQSILEEAVTNAGSAAEASRNASRAFEESIYSGLQDNLLGDLSGLLAGAINPMIDSLIGGAAASSAALAAGGAAAASSMATGGAIGASATAQGGAAAAGAMASGGSAAAGAMVSGGAAVGGVVSSVLDQARAYVNAYSQILSDPAIRDVIGQISGMVGDVAGIAYTGINTGGGGAWQSAGSPSAPGGGADEYNKALKSIGETIEDEVKRLRGLMVEDSPFSKDVLLAQFTTATAQARAGDKDALAKLPDLSKAIEAASAVTAVSAVEMARTRGWLAGSLEETLKTLGLTGAGGVTPVIAPTTPTTTPTPPKVITPIYNPAINGATMDPALLAAVKELNVTLKAIQSDGDADQVVNQNKLGAIHTTLRNIEELTALSLPTGVTA